MIGQLRRDYPSASFISELLQIYNGSFIVQARIIDNQSEAVISAIASGPTVESAEDKARERALEVFLRPGCRLLDSPEEIKVETKSEPKKRSRKKAEEPECSITSDTTEEAIAPEPPAAPEVTESTEKTEPPVIEEPPTVLESPQEAPLLELSSPVVEIAGDRPLLDFNEIMAKTTSHMARLGWTNEQGKDYLLQTYGKRSRQLLSDEELIEFLAYLENQ